MASENHGDPRAVKRWLETIKDFAWVTKPLPPGNPPIPVNGWKLPRRQPMLIAVSTSIASSFETALRAQDEERVPGCVASLWAPSIRGPSPALKVRLLRRKRHPLRRVRDTGGITKVATDDRLSYASASAARGTRCGSPTTSWRAAPAARGACRLAAVVRCVLPVRAVVRIGVPFELRRSTAGPESCCWCAYRLFCAKTTPT